MEKNIKSGQLIKRYSQKHKAIIVKLRKPNKCDLCLKVIESGLRAKELKGNIALGNYHIDCYNFYYKNEL